jgi:hypothetical protein
MPFDRAFHTVIVGDTLLFGSSADGKVHALNAATGEERWTFLTGGPVRFAPTVWRDRAFVVSDDGYLYCLGTQDGRLLWKLRGGPGDSMVLGNGRLISRWPARGGPVAADGVVYWAAGIWPSEGVFIYAVDALTGKVVWCNKTAGGLFMPQPHPTANAYSGVDDYYLGAGGVAYKKIVIAPTPGGRLTSADVRYDSIRGRIETAWKKSGDKLILHVTIPANTTATIIVPAKSADAIAESGKPLAKAPGVKFLRMDGDRAVLEAEAGSYRFATAMK